MILDTILALITEQGMGLRALKSEKQELEGQIRQVEAELQTLNDKALQIMQETGCEKTEYGGLTYSLRKVPPKVIVTDESLIPEKFFRIKKEINKALLNECYGGEGIPGAALDNGGYTIQKRSSK